MKHNSFIISVTALAGYLSATVAQVITSDALLNNHFVCPGRVVFTCETRGSQIIAWSSDEYIGVGNRQLTFTTDNTVGDTLTSTSNPRTVAILNRYDSGTQVLVSTLHITVPPNSRDACVRCYHGGSGNVMPQCFQVIADPGVPLDVIAIQIEHIVDNCIVIALWKRPVSAGSSNEILHYNIYANQTVLSNDIIISETSDNNTLISSLLSVPGCFVHYISVTAIDICDREGPRSSSIVLDPEMRHIAANVSKSNFTSCVSSGDTGKGNDDIVNLKAGLGVTLAASLVLAFVLGISTTILAYLRYC